MCGLVGMAGYIGPAEKRMFASLLWLNQKRGKHSTGLGLIREESESDTVTSNVIKAKGGLDSLVGHFKKEFGNKNILVDDSIKAVIGHGRFATIGEINANNAHPFDFKNVIGAHNGTVAKYLIDQLNVDTTNLSVDSQAIFAAISLGKPLNEIYKIIAKGAAALTWYSRVDHSINLLRNRDRPLHLMFLEREPGQKTLFWASEGWMLDVAVKREKVEIDKKVAISSLPVNTHYRIKLIDPDLAVETTALEVPTYSAYTRNMYQQEFGNYSQRDPYFGYGASSFKNTAASHISSSVNHSQNPRKRHASQLSLDGFFPFLGPDNLAAFEALTIDGCAYCAANLFWMNQHLYKWLDSKTCLCDECVSKFDWNKLTPPKNKAI